MSYGQDLTGFLFWLRWHVSCYFAGTNLGLRVQTGRSKGENHGYYLQAVNQNCPQFELQPITALEDVASWISIRTSINKSEVMMMLGEASEAILFYNVLGSPVKLKGGHLHPSMDRSGLLAINFRADVILKTGINNHGGYHGTVINKKQAGSSNANLKEL
jgi:hypothetical protein